MPVGAAAQLHMLRSRNKTALHRQELENTQLPRSASMLHSSNIVKMPHIA
jgi:hypothetical protein